MVRTHALFSHLTQRTSLPPIPKMAKIVGGIWLATLILAIPRWPEPLIVGLIVPLIQSIGFGLMAAIPVITAGYAGLVATSEAGRKEFDLVRVSRLTRKAIVMDLYYAVLYRLRGLYGALIAVLPGLMISGLYKGYITGREAITSSGIMIVSVGVWFGLAAMLGAALGIYLSLRWPRHPLALIGAPLILIVFMWIGAFSFFCPFYAAAPIMQTWLLDNAEEYTYRK